MTHGWIHVWQFWICRFELIQWSVLTLLSFQILRDYSFPWNKPYTISYCKKRSCPRIWTVNGHYMRLCGFCSTMLSYGACNGEILHHLRYIWALSSIISLSHIVNLQVSHTDILSYASNSFIPFTCKFNECLIPECCRVHSHLILILKVTYLNNKLEEWGRCVIVLPIRVPWLLETYNAMSPSDLSM